MATFVIESYLSAARSRELGDGIQRLRAAIRACSLGAGAVRHVRSYYVPTDELAFHLVEARSIEVVSAIATIADIATERIVEAEPATGS